MTATDIEQPADTSSSDVLRTSGWAAPTGWTLLALIVAVCFLAGAIGWTMGRERPPGRDSADVGFLHDMRTHHEGAVRLAQLELANGRADSIKVFAEEILRFQSYEIGLMDRMLIEWGYRPEARPDTAMGWMGHEEQPETMPGMATDAELELLRSGGDGTDATFVALMIDHHAAGAAMAEAAAARASDEDVRELAARMARIQRAEIGEMTAAAQRAGLGVTPPGVAFDAYVPASADGATTQGGHDHD